MAIQIDDSRFPVNVAEIRERFSAGDVEVFVRAGDRWLARQTEYALVVVTVRTGLPAFEVLKPALLWMGAHQVELARWLRAFALVTNSALVRGGFRAVLSLRPIAAEQLVTDDLERALAWAGLSLRTGAATHTRRA
jgi:hypothetical protein